MDASLIFETPNAVTLSFVRQRITHLHGARPEIFQLVTKDPGTGSPHWLVQERSETPIKC